MAKNDLIITIKVRAKDFELCMKKSAGAYSVLDNLDLEIEAARERVSEFIDGLSANKLF